MVDDHLDWHPTTPYTGRAFRFVSPDIQASMTPAPVGFQVGGIPRNGGVAEKVVSGVFVIFMPLVL